MGSAEDRLLGTCEVRDDGCWLWTGHIDKRSGYGRFTSGGRTYYAHRLAYETWVEPIPAGLHIDHLCRVRACLNPSHLEAVTQAENNRRAWAARFAGKTYPCGHEQRRGGPCPVCREARRAERAQRKAARSARPPRPERSGVRACGHPYRAPGDCPVCARARAARYRAQLRSGEAMIRTIICSECNQERPNCAKGLCRRCYTRLYKRATYVSATPQGEARDRPSRPRTPS